MSPLHLPRGIVIPLITPFDENGEVDFPVLRGLAACYRDHGVHGIFPLGSAGQGFAMRNDQRMAALEAIMETVGGSLPVIAQVGTVSAFEGVELARHAAAMEVAAIAMVPPFYYSDHLEAEIQQHFVEVAGGAPDLPVVVYDNPKYTGIHMTPAVVFRLSQICPHISGIKVAHSGLDQMLPYLRRLGPEFTVYSGSASYLMGGRPLGIGGAINPPMSPFPELLVDLWEALVKEDWESAGRHHARVLAVAGMVGEFIRQYGRSVTREIFRWRGVPIRRYPRWTTPDISEESLKPLRQALNAENVLTPIGFQ